MKKSLKIMLCCMTAVAMLTACGGGTTAKQGGDGMVKIGILADITSFDPHNHNDVVSGHATRSMYSNLVRLVDDKDFVGDLAEKWEYIDDKNVKFTLKPDVKFHNGAVLTSEDVKFSLEREMQSPKVGHLMAMIDSIEIVDDLNFIIHLKQPSNALISSLQHSGSAILNKEYTEGLEAAGKKLEAEPMGTGQYKFKNWTPGASYELEKFADYFDKDRAAQSDLQFKIISEESARTIALENGEIDLLISVGTNDADKVRNNSKLALDEYQSTQLETFSMNTQKPPFDNPLVRQAMNYAVNKNDVLTAAINNEGSVANGYLSTAAMGYYDTAIVYEYNKEKAKELLAEAGLSSGFQFTCFVSNDERARSATVIQANLAELGITMNIEQMEASTFFERTGKGEQDACMTGWVANAEPDNTYRPLFTSEKAGAGGNRAFYKNPVVDALIDDAASNSDKAAVEKNYREVQKILSEDAIWVPLYSKTGMVARNANLQGLVIYAMGSHDYFALHY